MILNHIERIEMKENNLEQEFFEALKTVITRLSDPIAVTRSLWVKGLIERSEKLCKQNTPELTPLEFIQSWAEMFNTPELKPCPFCGGSPILSENKENETLPQSWYVQCLNHKCPLEIMTLDYPSKKEAAKAWNTRASEKATVAVCDIFEDYFIKGSLPVCSSCIKDITREKE